MGEQLPATNQHGQWPEAGVPRNNTLNEPFSREELDAVLQHLKCNKAGGQQSSSKQLQGSYKAATRQQYSACHTLSSHC
jgi:hypothetical protein